MTIGARGMCIMVSDLRSKEDDVRKIRIFVLVGLVGFALSAVFAASSLDWINECSGGLGDSDNTDLNVLESFNGTLFAGILSVNDQAEVWARVLLGDSWTWAVRASGGFGDAGNLGVSSMAALPGVSPKLFMGTFNYTTGCELWYTTNGTIFYQTYTDGLGYGAANTDVNSMATFNGKVYAGTTNGNGLQIHEYDGSSWSAVVLNGFGSNTDNKSATCMVVHDGALFVGTENSSTGGEIWRTTNGVNWTRYLFGGFGQTMIGALASAGGALYAGIHRDTGMEVYAVGESFSFQVNTDGFGSSTNKLGPMVEHAGVLVVGAANFSAGAKVWRQDSFMNWSVINNPGFGDGGNTRVALGLLDGELFAGASNTSGAEIWVYPGIFADGFESGETVLWSSP